MLTANVGFKIPCGAVTDCKSLFSNCHLVTPNCEEKRLITDLAAIRECIERDDWRDLVWRPTEIQLADALTKPMDAHLLRQCLRTNEIPTRPYQKTKRERDAERKQQSQEKEREQGKTDNSNVSFLSVYGRESVCDWGFYACGIRVAPVLSPEFAMSSHDHADAGKKPKAKCYGCGKEAGRRSALARTRHRSSA